MITTFFPWRSNFTVHILITSERSFTVFTSIQLTITINSWGKWGVTHVYFMLQYLWDFNAARLIREYKSRKDEIVWYNFITTLQINNRFDTNLESVDFSIPQNLENDCLWFSKWDVSVQIDSIYSFSPSFPNREYVPNFFTV